MTRVIWSANETPAFRHFFHHEVILNEAWRLMPPEHAAMIPWYYEVEVLAFDYKEYRNEISGLAGINLKELPSGC